MDRGYFDFFELIQKEDIKNKKKFFFSREKSDITTGVLIENYRKLNLDNFLKKYLGKEIKGITLTESGMIGSSVFFSADTVKEFVLNKGKNSPKIQYFDKNKRRIEEYLIIFADFDVSFITSNKPKEYYWENYSRKYVRIPKNFSKEKTEKDINKIKEIFYKILKSKGKEISYKFKNEDMADFESQIFKAPSFFINPKKRYS